jgi:hypothetical protein
LKQNRSHWQSLSIPYHPGLHEAIIQHHHAAQFLSLVGKQLISQRADDSNSSMQYDPKNQMLVGEEIIPGIKLALLLSDNELKILQNGTPIPSSLSLLGLTISEAFNRLAHLLNKEGIKTDVFHSKLHYEISDHELLHSAPFKQIEPQLLREHINYRHNAQLVLQKIGQKHPEADTLRIWPHHFDTGTILPVRSNSDGETIRSLGMGWAIPDAMVEEPYFYLSLWSASPLEMPQNIPKLKAGTWKTPNWNGAILPMSEILQSASPEEQESSTLSFFESGIEILLKEEY